MRRRLTVIALVLSAITVSLPASGQQDWYATVPDFSHRGATPDYHAALFNPENGNRDRPMLVIHHDFTDFATSEPVAEIEKRAFGDTNSVRDYFEVSSEGAFEMTPAIETDGVWADGVVRVTYGTTEEWVDAWDAAGRREHGPLKDFFGELVKGTDDAVDFSRFDANDDGRVTRTELLVVFVHPPLTDTDNCGALRGITPPQLDDVLVGESSISVSEAANLMTVVHEVGHQGFDMKDTYGFGSGGYDIGGPSCGGGDRVSIPNAWHRLHWGWGAHSVVTEDGYYDMTPIEDGGISYVLYDPEQGERDYFLVEARRATGYSTGMPDEGIAVWRVADDKYHHTTDILPPVELMRPDGVRLPPACRAGTCYGGRWDDLFNPTDPTTPEREMTRPWLEHDDPARVAVRGIQPDGPFGRELKAYFDVRGPGVLVDAVGTQLLLNDAPSTLQVPVMNTGEEADAFTFRASNLPVGWTAQPATVTMAAAQRATANLNVDTGGRFGADKLAITGASDSDAGVSSTDDLTAVVATRDYVEPNDSAGSAAGISPRELSRLSTAIFNVFSKQAHTTGHWFGDRRTMTLDTARDEDFYSFRLPEPWWPSDHRGVDCATLAVGEGIFRQDVIVSSAAVVRALFEPEKSSRDPFDRVAVHGVPSTGTALERTVTCPRSEGDVDELVFSFGDRPLRVQRTLGAAYRPTAEYRVDAVRVPRPAEWLVAEREARGLRSVLAMPCPGGFFPRCLGGPRAVFDVQHPIDPSRSPGCVADGCPDWFPFRVSSAQKLDVVLASDVDLQFRLLDQHRNVVAEAVGAPFFDGRDQGTFARSGGTDSAPEAGDWELPPPDSTTKKSFTKRLVTDLQEGGFYVLEVTGPQAAFTVDLVSEIPDTDRDLVEDSSDNCLGVPNMSQNDIDGDGAGDQCDDANVLTLDIMPGSDENPVRPGRKGVVPVAVLSSEFFDATALPAGAACFGDAEEPAERSCGEAHGRIHEEDVDGDGLPDAVMHFASDGGVDAGDSEACLSVQLEEGLEAAGCDRVRTVG